MLSTLLKRRFGHALAKPPVSLDSGLKALYRGSWLKGVALFGILTLIGLLTGFGSAYAPEVLLV